jgi:hypothetical protein
MSYSVTIEFPSTYAFGEFEHMVSKIINDGSGMGFGKREITGYFTTQSKASSAYRRLSNICKNYPNIDANIEVIEHTW